MPDGRGSGRRLLLGTVTGQAGRVAAGAGLSAVHQAAEALVPVLIGVVIDRAVAPRSAAALGVWIAILAVTFAGLSASFRIGARTGEEASERAAHGLRVRLTARVLHPAGGAEAGRLPGELVSIATADAQRVGGVNLALALGVAALFGVLVGAAALLRVSLPLGLLVLFGAPLLLVVAHLLGRPLRRRSELEQEGAAQAVGVAADLIRGLRVLKGIGAERAAAQRYRRTSRDSLAATLRAARAKAWHDGALLAATGVFLALVALVGGRLAARGDITVGELVSAVGLAQFLLGPLSLFAWVSAELARARAAADRIAAVLSAPHKVTSGTGVPARPVRGHLSLHGLTDRGLRGLSLDVAPGELVGIATADPGCAAALVDCLAREREPEAGDIQLDGRSVRELEPAAARAAVLVAAHDADLFEGTLVEAITPATGPKHNPAGPERDAADPDRLRRALAAAAADDLADDGADDLVQSAVVALAERGRSLSGGQRQRVALARALAADPPVLVLHDPTTAVDAVTELRIAAGLRELRRGRTTVLLTTSPALLSITDRVVLLDGGAVAAEGTHARLVKEHPGYRTAVLS